jgi:hypothetical protein
MAAGLTTGHVAAAMKLRFSPVPASAHKGVSGGGLRIL